MKLSANPPIITKPKTSHRRSRSLSEMTFVAPLTIPAPSAPGTVAIDRGLKLSCANLGEAKGTSQGLEQIKQTLLREIKTKLKKQIESKKLECHTDEAVVGKHTEEEEEEKEKQQQIDTNQKATSSELPEKDDKESVLKSVLVEPISPDAATVADNPVTATTQHGDSDGNNNTTKRFSICSLSGVELRKRYSPVYERTRKIVRQSSGSIDRWSSSQPQVVGAQPSNGPNSPSASVNTERTATVLTPVTSKGDLEVEKEGEDSSVPVNNKEKKDSKANLRNGDTSLQHNVTMNASNTKIGQYSAHPSVYVIEQDQNRTGVGMDDSRSDRMDRSTSTLKRGASFKGLRKNLKKASWCRNGSGVVGSC